MHANNNATTWSCNRKERQTNTKVYNDGHRAHHAAMKSCCGNRLTHRQTNRQIHSLLEHPLCTAESIEVGVKGEEKDDVDVEEEDVDVEEEDLEEEDR